MKTFWLTFTDGTKGCCQGENAYDAKVIAEKISGKKVAGGDFKDIEAKTLPYPAQPIIWQFEHPAYGKCPPFCFKTDQCAGTRSCSQNYDCSE